MELTEDIHVYQYQATAREKRDDFFDAEQVMKAAITSRTVSISPLPIVTML